MTEEATWGRIYLRLFKILLPVAAVLGVYVWFLSRDLPSPEQLENFDPNLQSQILSSNGEILNEFFIEKRTFIDLSNIPKNMTDALLASEDHRFYDHWGLSMPDLIRAIVVDIFTLSFEQGFSSITQQLARNLYDSIGFKKTISRKVKEILTAIQIERRYTKGEILEMYLNSVHFGHGTYGVAAAARQYYRKDARELTLDECATLVGLLPAPASYSPINHPDRSLKRRNVVLSLMEENDFITKEELEKTKMLPLSVSLETYYSGIAPYYTEHIRRILEKEDSELGIDIYRDGLDIQTSLDSRLQIIAEQAVQEMVVVNQAILNKRLLTEHDELARLVDLNTYPEEEVRQMLEGVLPIPDELKNKLLVQAAFVALDPTNGHIKAMVGGRLDHHDQFNRAVQALRQPGSTFKPFVWVSAIDQGYPVIKKLLNQPIVVNVQNAKGEWEKWIPENYDNSVGGPTTLKEGLAKSLNLIAVRIVQELVPPREVAAMAKQMKITSPMRPVDAIALGTSEVTLLDIVSSFGAFANGGVWSSPMALLNIRDRTGDVIKVYNPIREEVLSEQTAFIMTYMMQQVIKSGTGNSARWKYNFHHPTAGKTGTTQDWTDAWFVGYTPYMVAGIWMGVDDPAVTLGTGQDGAHAALPVWANFMRQAHEVMGWAPKDFEVPEGVSLLPVCTKTKDLATRYCPVEKEWFIDKYIPKETCNVHKEGGITTKRREDEYDY